MLTWAQKQKTRIGVIGLAGFILFAAASFLILRSQPSCRNGVKDDSEKGPDCGGVCTLLCKGDALSPLVHFARAVEVGKGVWGGVAYLENRNEGAGARNVPYVLKVYDAKGTLAGEKHGIVYVPPRKVFAVFQGNMNVGDRVPVRATFAFETELRFERMAPEPALGIGSEHFETSDTGSRLEAALSNQSLSAVSNIAVTALLYDAEGNVFAASATAVNKLGGQSTAPLSFTWPQKLSEPARIEILYTVSGR